MCDSNKTMSQFQCNHYRLLIPEINGRSQFMGLMKVNPNHKKKKYIYIYIYIYPDTYTYAQTSYPHMHRNTQKYFKLQGLGHRNVRKFYTRKDS